MDQRESITLAHGSGGQAMHRLIDSVFRSRLVNPILEQRDDAAELAPEAGRLAFTTDSYVVRPLFFPGGDIGRLAVCGTVNDLAMKGARPLYLTASFIIGEGLSLEILERVVDSMARAAAEAQVSIVAGDTKVVERAACDGLFITTSGIGRIEDAASVSGSNIQPGDVLIISGTMGDHGLAVMNARGDLGLGGDIASDVAPLWDLVAMMLGCGGVRALRDPTRGGLATTLNELAEQSGVRLVVDEEKVPVKDWVRAGAELLGLDPLYLANEGKLAALVEAGKADDILGVMQRNPKGRQAAVIGRAEAGEPGVILKTSIGSHRPLLMLEGEHLPRIC